jgi:predicted amidophosphoribosyltransferase
VDPQPLIRLVVTVAAVKCTSCGPSILPDVPSCPRCGTPTVVAEVAELEGDGADRSEMRSIAESMEHLRPQD